MRPETAISESMRQYGENEDHLSPHFNDPALGKLSDFLKVSQLIADEPLLRAPCHAAVLRSKTDISSVDIEICESNQLI
jgi:hypothetical protein